MSQVNIIIAGVAHDRWALVHHPDDKHAGTIIESGVFTAKFENVILKRDPDDLADVVVRIRQFGFYPYEAPALGGELNATQLRGFVFTDGVIHNPRGVDLIALSA